MKAMILAAGLGTRLRPLTDDRPKALVEVAGRTLLEIALTRLSSFAIRDVIINVHHFADKIVDYLNAHENFGMHIEISREDVLLDTGGGLKKAGWFFLKDSTTADEPFLLHNVDILSTIDLGRMIATHREKKALATLAVQQRDSSRLLIFDENLQLCGRRAGRDQEPEIVRPSANLQPKAFCGVHVISPRLLRLMQEDGVFSIIDLYLRLAARGENILGFPADEYYWRDLGKLEQVRQAAEDYKQKLYS
jgi:NDP-sugar pyrophosphorylase family protein